SKDFSGAQFPEAYSFACRRVDGDANFAESEEENVLGLIEIVEDRFARRIVLPGAAAFDPFDGVRRQFRKRYDRLQCVALLDLRLSHELPWSRAKLNNINQVVQRVYVKKLHRNRQTRPTKN